MQEQLEKLEAQEAHMSLPLQGAVLSARVRTTQASGTILAKAFPDGRWRNGGGAGQAKPTSGRDSSC